MSGYFLFVHINEWAPFHSADTIPISAGYILSSLKRHGFSGDIVGDYKDKPLAPEVIHQKITRYQPIVVGFSTYAENMDRVRFWAKFVKKTSPKIKTIIGGPQVTFMPAEALRQMSEIDFLCRGDGEIIMPELAKTLTGNSSPSHVPGISFLVEDKIVETPPACLPDDLDELPSPYLDSTLMVNGRDRAILFSSRGCNGNCAFCYTPHASGYKLRFHSAERVVQEMQHLKKQGINSFWFADPNFASSRKRVEDICLAITKHVESVQFWCQGRYQHFDEALASLLKKAGATTVAFGLESSSATTQKTIRKNVRPDKLSKAIKICQKNGIEVELFSLFGLPGDTLKSSLETIQYVRENKVAIEGNSISQQLHLFFGVTVNDKPQDFGISPLPVTKPAYHSPCRDFITSDMTKEDIETMGLIWRLNRTDFEEHVEQGHDLFNIAGFINKNFKKLENSPRRDLLLSRIYRKLDEVYETAKALQRLKNNWSHLPEVKEELEKPKISYLSKRRTVVQHGCKVIFDCKGFLGGKAIPETELYFHLAVIGEGKLLPEFENQLIGIKSGSATQFEVRFPADYRNKKLAGQTIPFQVYVHQVLNPVLHGSLTDMMHNHANNKYRFDDLLNVKKHNEPLYYMVLRDSVLHSLTGNLNDMIALFDYYLKLGFFEKALDLVHSLHFESSLIGHIGKILQINGHGEEALDFLDRVKGDSPEIENQRIRAHIQLQQFNEAEQIAANPLLQNNMETLNLKVKLAERSAAPLPAYLRRVEKLLDVQTRLAHARVQHGRE